MMLEVEIVNEKSGNKIVSCQVPSSATIKDLKNIVYKRKKNVVPDRQSLKLKAGGKRLNDDSTLESLGIKNGGIIYFKDLGMQVGWTTVFLTEYAGPLFLYLIVYMQPEILYGTLDPGTHFRAPVVHIAAACWALHYSKRLLETLFVHRFSNATMPILNIFKNSGYYWGFALYVSYHINHPLYTPPDIAQTYVFLALFMLCELGNLSIHWALRMLRPANSRVRRIPMPTSNPFTRLFSYVSCPNYTYEVGAWASFALMTQCLPAGIFCAVGFYQMTVWALGKHKNYLKEFPNYPRMRKAILPFII